MKISDELLTLMVELEERALKEDHSFQRECLVFALLELKQRRAEERIRTSK